MRYIGEVDPLDSEVYIDSISVILTRECPYFYEEWRKDGKFISDYPLGFWAFLFRGIRSSYVSRICR